MRKPSHIKLSHHASPLPSNASDIKTLREFLESAIIPVGSSAYEEMRSRLQAEYEKALKGVHNNKICHLSDGRWKTKNPQIIRKTRLALLEALYEYYFHVKVRTVMEVYEEWLEEFKEDTESAHRSVLSYDRFRSDWKRFFANYEIAGMNIAEIKASTIKKHYKIICANEAITRKTLNNAKSLLNHIFDHAVDNDYVAANVARSVMTKDIRCKEVDNDEKVYTDAEREKVIEQAEKENEVFARAIALMFCSCTRIGEIRALKWEDVDLEGRTMYIHREIVRRKDSSGHETYVCVNRTKSGLKEGNRTQPLSSMAIRILKAQRRENPFGEYVFMYKYAPLVTNTINHHLMRICERAGVPYMSSHKIRFWSITNMYANDMPQADIQRLAGHADPATTNHYKRPSRLGNFDSEKWEEMFG